VRLWRSILVCLQGVETGA